MLIAYGDRYELFVSFILFFVLKGQYEQNLCDSVDASCVQCPQRLPSCVGLNDGANYFPGRQWTSNFIICFKNRTITISKCKGNHEYFHPAQRNCITDVAKGTNKTMDKFAFSFH